MADTTSRGSNSGLVVPSPAAGEGTPLAGGPPLLDMRAITKSFAGGQVLKGVDFAVAAGEVHALVGENGAGKSTLMKILAGLYPDYGGEVLIDGEVVDMKQPRTALAAGVAVIYQEFSLVPDLTVAENIALGREQRAGAPGLVAHRATRRRSAQEADELGIRLPMEARVSELGVAEQQMTEIVGAVARRARILVMDEPTARLADHERERLFGIMRALCKRGVGIVYISHFLEEVFAVSDRVTVLRDGERVGCLETGGLRLPTLAHMMVGEKYQEIRQRHDAGDGDGGSAAELAIRLEEVAVEGRVRPVSLEIARGQVVGFAGLDGSGRTELAEALIGVAPGARGRVVMDGYAGLPRDPQAAARAGILLVPQDRKQQGIVAYRSIADNILLTALAKRFTRGGFVRRKAARKHVAELLDRFSVRPRNAGAIMRSLSGGNQQKVIFARAVAAQASVLILDQPTAGVDIGAKVELYDQIDELTAAGVAVLLISDDLVELLRLSDTIVFMRNGVASAPAPASAFDRPKLLEAITGGGLSAGDGR